MIIATFARMSDAEARDHAPSLVFVDGKNRIVRTYDDIAPNTPYRVHAGKTERQA